MDPHGDGLTPSQRILARMAELEREDALGDAKVMPNGKILSGISGVAEFTDSDGQVYKCEPCPRQIERHRVAVMAFKATVRDRWVARSRSVRPCQPRVRVGRTQRPRARRSARRAATRTRAGPDSDEPAPALALAPPPSAIYSYAASRCPSCGAVLLWSDGRLVCASRSCPRWGKAA